MVGWLVCIPATVHQSWAKDVSPSDGWTYEFMCVWTVFCFFFTSWCVHSLCADVFWVSYWDCWATWSEPLSQIWHRVLVIIINKPSKSISNIMVDALLFHSLKNREIRLSLMLSLLSLHHCLWSAARLLQINSFCFFFLLVISIILIRFSIFSETVGLSTATLLKKLRSISFVCSEAFGIFGNLTSRVTCRILNSFAGL